MFVTATIVIEDEWMELQQMRYVLAVADTNNFTRAAERCLVVQSALSHQIARLERELGTKLFERTSRRVRLTPAGEAFLSSAAQCVAAAERAAADVAAALGQVRGTLSIGLIPTVAAVDVPARLRDFRARYPDVRLRLRVGASEDLVEQVKDGDIDIAFLGLPTTQQPHGVRFHELARDKLVAIVAPDHPLASRRSVTLRQLSTETFVDLPRNTAGRAQTDQAFASAHLTREVAMEVSTADLITLLVAAGLGVAMAASTYVTRLTGVATVDISDAPARVEYLIRADADCSPATRAFLSMLDLEEPTTPA